jgi:hypothetical protein
MTAAAERASHLAARLEQSKREEQERLDRIVAEFDGDPRAMAAEILQYRRATMQIVDALEWRAQGRAGTGRADCAVDQRVGD